MKRLSPMNVEVMGSTTAGAGRWWNWTDGRSALAVRYCCCQFRIWPFQLVVMTDIAVAAVPLRDLNEISGAVAHSLSSPLLSFVCASESDGVRNSSVRDPFLRGLG